MPNLTSCHKFRKAKPAKPSQVPQRLGLIKTLRQLNQVLKEHSCAFDDTSELHSELVPVRAGSIARGAAGAIRKKGKVGKVVENG